MQLRLKIQIAAKVFDKYVHKFKKNIDAEFAHNDVYIVRVPSWAKNKPSLLLISM